MLRWMHSLAISVALLALAAGPVAASGDRPVVRIPALEQGGQVQGDQMVDIVMKPADDGAPLLKLDVSIDNEAVITFDLQPVMRNVTFNWVTSRWTDGRHDVVARVVDSKGRVGSYRTFVYIWNKGKPQVSNKPASVEVVDTDGQPDGVITQRALIQVKVDPRLGAKWVILYLNDKMVAMMNYPPYQEVLDPAKRQLADGPYVVRARVIHPDNSETLTDPVTVQVNLHGTRTPLRQPGPAPVSPVSPTAPNAPTDLAPIPAVQPSGAPKPVVPADVPGAARPSETSLPATTRPLDASRPGAPQAIRPPVADVGQVELGGTPAVTGGSPASTGTTVPAAPPVTTVPHPAKPAVQRAPVLGPRIPPRSAAGATVVGGVQDSASASPAGVAHEAVTRMATPYVSLRLAEPRTSVGTGYWFGQPRTSQAAGVPSSASSSPLTSLPGGGLARPLLDSGLTSAAGLGETGVAQPRVATTGSYNVLGTPAGYRRGEPALDRAGAQRPGSEPTATAGLAGGPGSAQAATRGEVPGSSRAVASSGVAARPAGEPGTAPASQPRGVSGMSETRTAVSAGMRQNGPVPTATPVPATRTSSASATPAIGAPQAKPLAPKSAGLPQSGAPATIGRVHVLQKGETLAMVARRYHTSISALLRINGVATQHQLKVGKRLVVPTTVTVNGKLMHADVAPLQQKGGVATSPLRFVVEALGGTVTWLGPAAKQVTAEVKGRGVLTFTVGSPEVRINEERVLMDVAAYIDSGRTMVPLRFIGQALDVTIEVDEDSGNITIRSNR